ncbi:KUP system potassium uptake protein [Luteimonas sp. J16]|jgi:KUP system potassium uptake protein|uniref:potassium transporter Kup n=1 Tax=unclassified Luteimonas TaxID=2629088 RepID=UPI000478B693|nr:MULTISPECIES: potassium transporter Kup [unclassified Luteimonas]TWG90486.1 KUP system potassium uptake protein [Luteimonas sp. J16]
MSRPASQRPAAHAAPSHGPGRIGLAGLAVGAIGVVFGDIGTSPLYTIREAFSPHYGLVADHDTVLGVLSMIFWALTLVVTVKYVTIIMRADNDGEGGIMALMALAQRCVPKDSRTAYVVGIVGILGASLFFGDGVITPAISVLSAVEGLEVVAPGLHAWIVPITVLVLLALFATQRYGTEKVGRIFGPVTVVWFLALAALGVANILHAPEVLHAINPWWAARFFAEHAWGGIFILGAVVLAVTGGEAIYTDMGHFGPRPIRYAWYFFVLPSLMLNYLGQGALVLEDPAAIRNPFYVGVPDWAQWPMLLLATLATVIASQAVITGGYSIARQAMQLGYIPRMRIKHTSSETIGQIYIPAINWTMAVIVVGLVLSFGSSSALAAAYGISVSATMLIDTLLLALVARALWPGARRWVLPLCVLFLLIDLAFLVANGAKVLQGAWFPVVLGIVLFTMLRTWRRGREILREEMQKEGIRLDAFIPGLMLAPPVRVEGTAVFMTSDKGVVPHALLHNLKHNKVLHERNVFLTVDTLSVPYATPGKRLSVETLGDGFYRVVVRFGFMETPDVPQALMQAPDHCDLSFDPMETTYFVSRETVVSSARRGMPVWRDKLFAVMHRNAAPANQFFRIPGNRLVELGAQVEI